MSIDKNLTLAKFDEEPLMTALALQAKAAEGLDLQGFVSTVLPYAIRIQELRNQGFQGEIVLNISGKGGKIKHSEKSFGDSEELREKYQIG